MIRAHFEEYLKDLEKELMEMSEMVISAINRSITAIQKMDISEAEKIIADDKKVNFIRRDVEQKSINLIATQQPVATDLREIISFLDIITNLERMGDHAKGIAQIVLMLKDLPQNCSLFEIPNMAAYCQDMIKRCLQAFISRDAEGSRKIIQEDNVIDKFKEQLYHELLSSMLADPQTIKQATFLLWVTHNLERISDRVTNICKQTIYLVTGSID